jgi:hypothetical protein
MHIDSPKGFCLDTSGIYIYTLQVYIDTKNRVSL